LNKTPLHYGSTKSLLKSVDLKRSGGLAGLAEVLSDLVAVLRISGTAVRDPVLNPGVAIRAALEIDGLSIGEMFSISK
jgi:hypothetical protein